MNSNSESYVSSLRDMQEQMTQWQSEKPTGNWGDELRLQDDDLVIFQFAANGDEGKKFLNVYRSHVIERMSKRGTRYNENRYCPVQSGEKELECPLCIQGHITVKERMSVWMHVQNILHTTMPPEKQFPQVRHEGNVYFNEEVNAFKIWHTSGWKESPWNDIRKNGEIYKGLHNFTANLQVVGRGLDKRYKLYAIPNSPTVSPELYAKANEECTPILDLLHGQISSTVQVAPTSESGQSASTGTNPNVMPFVPTGTNIPTLGNVAPPVEPPPVEEETPETETPTVPPPPPEETAPPPNPAATEKETETPDDKRPLKSLF
jgi:hypothetical protein